MTRRSITWLIATAAIAAVTLPAAADQGDGRWKADRTSVIARSGALPLSRLGRDVIRFSASPALGGRTFIVELYATDDKRAGGEVRFYWGHRAFGWQRRGRMRIDFTRADYDALAAIVDAALAESMPPSDPGDKSIAVCADGMDWVTERRRKGRSSWLTGSCDDDRNEAIHQRIAQIIETQAARYARK